MQTTRGWNFNEMCGSQRLNEIFFRFDSSLGVLKRKFELLPVRITYMNCLKIVLVGERLLGKSRFCSQIFYGFKITKFFDFAM